MAEREYTPEEARKLEEKYQQGTMTPENRPLWEQRRGKYQSLFSPPVTGIDLSPQPPAAFKALPPSPPAPQALPAGPTPASPTQGLPEPMDVTKITGPRSYLQQVGRGLDYATQVNELARREHPDVEEFGGQLMATVLLSQIPGGQPVAAARYARMAPMAQKAYWVAREMLAPMARYATIGAGTGAVPLLFGKPMSEAVQTALYTALGEMAGGVGNRERERVMGAVRQALRESPEGATTGRVLTEVGQPTTVGMRTGSERWRQLEAELRGRIGGGGLRQIQERGEQALGDELRVVERQLGVGAGPLPATTRPDEWLKASLEARKGAFTGQAERRFGEIDDIIARARPDTGVFPRERIETLATMSGGPAIVPQPPAAPLLPPRYVRPEDSPRVPLWQQLREPGQTPQFTSSLSDLPTPQPSPGTPRRPLWANIPPDIPSGADVPLSPPRQETFAPRPRTPVPEGIPPTSLVRTGPAKTTAATILAELQRTGVPATEAQGMLKNVLDKPELLSFRDAQRLRSDLLAITRQTHDLVPDKANRYARQLADALDKEMAYTARTNGPGVYQAWREANEWFKRQIAKFDNFMIDRVLKAAPDDVYSVLAREGSPIAIKSAREAIDNPLLWNRVGQSWLQTALADVTHPLTQTVDGAKLLQRLKTFGPEALRELFPRGHGEDVYTLALSLAQIQRGGGTAPWNRVIQTLRGGALLIPLGYEGTHEVLRRQAEGEGRLPGESARWPWYTAFGTIMLSPALLAKAMGNPRLVRALLEGTQATGDARRRMEIAGGIVGLLSEEGLLQAPPSAAPAP